MRNLIAKAVRQISYLEFVLEHWEIYRTTYASVAGWSCILININNIYIYGVERRTCSRAYELTLLSLLIFLSVSIITLDFWCKCWKVYPVNPWRYLVQVLFLHLPPNSIPIISILCTMSKFYRGLQSYGKSYGYHE